MQLRSREGVRRSFVAVLIMFQLGALVLACPMPERQAIAKDAAVSAKCEESHEHSPSNGHASDATGLCKARIGVYTATLSREGAIERAKQLFDAVPAVDLTIRSGFALAQYVYATHLPLIVQSTPPNLKYRVIRI